MTNRNSEPTVNPTTPEDMQPLVEATSAHISNLALGVHPTARTVIEACESHTVAKERGYRFYHAVHGLDLVPANSTSIHMKNLNMYSGFSRVWQRPVRGSLRPWTHRLNLVEIEMSGYTVEGGLRDSLETSQLRSIGQASSGWTDESDIRRSTLSFLGDGAYASNSEAVTDITTIHYGRLTAAQLVVGTFNGLAERLGLEERAPGADPALVEQWRALGKPAAVEQLDEYLARLLPGIEA